jgi:hypothetical protein
MPECKIYSTFRIEYLVSVCGSAVIRVQKRQPTTKNVSVSSQSQHQFLSIYSWLHVLAVIAGHYQAFYKR